MLRQPESIQAGWAWGPSPVQQVCCQSRGVVSSKALAHIIQSSQETFDLAVWNKYRRLQAKRPSVAQRWGDTDIVHVKQVAGQDGQQIVLCDESSGAGNSANGSVAWNSMPSIKPRPAHIERLRLGIVF